MVVSFVCTPGVPSVAGVLSALRSLAFIPISFTLAYVVRGEKLTMQSGKSRSQAHIISYHISISWGVAMHYTVLESMIEHAISCRRGKVQE